MAENNSNNMPGTSGGYRNYESNSSSSSSSRSNSIISFDDNGMDDDQQMDAMDEQQMNNQQINQVTIEEKWFMGSQLYIGNAAPNFRRHNYAFLVHFYYYQQRVCCSECINKPPMNQMTEWQRAYYFETCDYENLFFGVPKCDECTRTCASEMHIF
jgi:hypothetical protein